MDALLITIDGPAGAGKTTVSRRLAARLGYRYIDTGALYRGVALAASRAGVAPDDDRALADLCRGLRLTFRGSGEGGQRLFLREEDVTDLIRTPEISLLASGISARPVVRGFLLELQRRLGRAKRAVFEGRDMGTVVFPGADVKFYLDAEPGERARRRFTESAAATGQSLESVAADMDRRDRQDRSRPVAPLKPAPDAIRVDSTGLSIDGVVDCMLAHIAARRAGV
jgi:cytidylate kinase